MQQFKPELVSAQQGIMHALKEELDVHFKQVFTRLHQTASNADLTCAMNMLQDQKEDLTRVIKFAQQSTVDVDFSNLQQSLRDQRSDADHNFSQIHKSLQQMKGDFGPDVISRILQEQKASMDARFEVIDAMQLSLQEQRHEFDQHSKKMYKAIRDSEAEIDIASLRRAITDQASDIGRCFTEVQNEIRAIETCSGFMQLQKVVKDSMADIVLTVIQQYFQQNKVVDIAPVQRALREQRDDLDVQLSHLQKAIKDNRVELDVANLHRVIRDSRANVDVAPVVKAVQEGIEGIELYPLHKSIKDQKTQIEWLGSKLDMFMSTSRAGQPS
jgi:hypothetical protein